VSPVKYELGIYIPEDDILHSHRSENLKSYMLGSCLRSVGFRDVVEPSCNVPQIEAFVPFQFG
jgi:hypothetical protein